MSFLPVLLLLLTLSPVRSQADVRFRFDLANAIAFYTDDPTEQEVLGRIAYYESAFRPDVAKCATLGDHGRSLGIYQNQAQTPGDRRAACGSLHQQTQLALATIRRSAAACPGFRGADTLAVYVSGRCVRKLPQARHRWALLGEQSEAWERATREEAGASESAAKASP